MLRLHLLQGRIIMNWRWLCIGLTLAATPPGYALNLAGVEVAPMVRVPNEPRPWPLLGSAMVHRSFIPFYGLAMHGPADAGVREDIGMGLTPVQITLVWYANALPKEQVQEHFRKLFEHAADAETMARVGSRLDKFLALLPAAERGRQMTFYYSPDAGTLVTVEGGASDQFAGIEFNRTLLAMWLGPKADPDVRAGLHGAPATETPAAGQ
jgi:hypothetical protein